jgi:GH35 family endo-1,4-beta-xylanase
MQNSRCLHTSRHRAGCILALIAACGIALPAGASAQNLPSGARLRNITDSTLVGAKTSEGPSGAPATVCDREFDAIQMNWYPNWGGWTGPYAYDTSRLDAWVNWAHGKSRPVVMHMFTGWDQYLPDWFKDGSWSNQDMETLLREMVRRVVEGNDNKSKVYCWNSVNEVFSDSAGAYRSTNKLYQLGWESDASGLVGSDYVNASHPVFVRKTFEWTRQYAGSNAKIELRDYAIEFDPNGVKLRAFHQLAAHLLAKGIQLDAVGLQCHLGLYDTYNWDNFKAVVKKLKRLGVEVYVTEYDCGTYNHHDGLDNERQRQAFYEAYRAAREAGVEAFFPWGIADGKDAGWRASEQPLAFDENYNPKPAYYGSQQALEQTRRFLVRARGSSGGEVLELRIDGRTMDTWVLSREWTDYCYSSYSGTRKVELAFVNDGTLYGRDKNVQVDYLRVNGTVYQTESVATNSGGSGEWMYWNGILNFGNISGPAAPLPNGKYRITPRHALDKSVDVSGASSADGANTQIWTYVGGNNQEWILTHKGSGWYEIRARHSGKVLDVSGSNSANGTKVHQYTVNNTSAQRWRLEASENGWFRVTPQVAQDKCLDVSGVSSDNGANLQIWSYGGGGNQQWKFEAF